MIPPCLLEQSRHGNLDCGDPEPYHQPAVHSYFQQTRKRRKDDRFHFNRRQYNFFVLLIAVYMVMKIQAHVQLPQLWSVGHHGDATEFSSAILYVVMASFSFAADVGEKKRGLLVADISILDLESSFKFMNVEIHQGSVSIEALFLAIRTLFSFHFQFFHEKLEG